MNRMNSRNDLGHDEQCYKYRPDYYYYYYYLAGCRESSLNPQSSEWVDDKARQEVNQCFTVYLSSPHLGQWISNRAYSVVVRQNER